MFTIVGKSGCVNVYWILIRLCIIAVYRNFLLLSITTSVLEIKKEKMNNVIFHFMRIFIIQLLYRKVAKKKYKLDGNFLKRSYNLFFFFFTEIICAIYEVVSNRKISLNFNYIIQKKIAWVFLHYTIMPYLEEYPPIYIEWNYGTVLYISCWHWI